MCPTTSYLRFQIFWGYLLDIANLSKKGVTSHRTPKTLRVFLFLIVMLFSELDANLERLEIVVVSKIPHDTSAYTQGLAIEQNLLYESTGLYGQSTLRCIELPSGRVSKTHPLSIHIFAEGIAAFPDHLLQISWKEQQAFIYERETLSLLKTLSYQGEGWGLCRDGESVWMSDGTSVLTLRDPGTLKILKKLKVRYNGRPLVNLNDLECVDNDLYANVWMKNFIVRIDKQTGDVLGLIDASSLLSPEERGRLSFDDVLNGIAYRPATGTFFLTGKRWPWIFEVNLKK